MGGLIGILVVVGFVTCKSNDATSACPTPVPNSDQANLLTQARGTSKFPLVYPCYLPNVQDLTRADVTGVMGKQQAELVFSGTFDLTVRESQVAPAVSADPAGASRRTIDLFPNVQATFIERNDGTKKALYHLLWSQNNVFYEIQAFGPPLQSDVIVQVARSLQ